MAVDGKVTYKVDYDTKDAKKELNSFSNTLDNVGDKAGKVGSFMTRNVTAPLLGVGGAAVAGFTKLSSELDDIAKSATGVGAGVEGLQAWQFAGRKAGVATEEMNNLLRKLQQAATQNADAFWELGIQTQDAEGNMVDTDMILSQLVTSLDDMSTSERNAVLLSMGLTRELEDMNKIMEDTDGLAANLETGLENAISDESIKKFEEFNDTIEDMKLQLIPIGVDIANELMPHLQDFADWLADDGIENVGKYTSELVDMVAEHWELVAVIAALGPSLKILSGLLTVLSSTAGAVTAGIGAAGVAAAGIAKTVDDYVDENLGFTNGTPQMFYNIGAQLAQDQDLANMYLDPRLRETGYGTVNIASVEVNTSTSLSPENQGQLVDDIMHEVTNELTGRRVFSQ